jgi:hypothetical protein
LWLEVLAACPALIDKDENETVLLSQINAVEPSSAVPPEETRTSIHVANIGFIWCYRRCPAIGCDALRTNASTPLARARQCIHYDGHGLRYDAPTRRVKLGPTPSQVSWNVEEEFRLNAAPTDPRELEWLASFLKAVAWMEESFPAIAKRVLDSHAKDVELIEYREEEQREVREEMRREKKNKVELTLTHRIKTSSHSKA